MNYITSLNQEWIFEALHLYEEGTISFSNINELLSLINGRKRLFRFGAFNSHKIKKVMSIIELLNLKYVVNTSFVNFEVIKETGDKFLNDKGEKTNIFYWIFASRNEKDLLIASEIEYNKDIDSINFYYGYPTCCIKAYMLRSNNNWWNSYIGTYCNRYTNKIAELFQKPTFMNEYFPCSGNCNETINNSLLNKLQLLKILGTFFVESVDKSLSRVYSVDKKIKEIGKFQFIRWSLPTKPNNIFYKTQSKFYLQSLNNKYIIFT